MKNSKAKCLMIGPLPPPIGGQSILVETMLLNVSELDYDIFNITHSQQRVFFRSVISISFILKLFVVLIKGGKSYGLVHIHTSAGAPLIEKCLMAGLCRLFQIPSVLHIHGGKLESMFDHSNMAKRRFLQFVLLLPSAFIVLSKKMKDVLWHELANKKEIFVLENPSRINGEDEHEFVKESANNKFNLLYIGHIKRNKGLLELLVSFEKLQRKNPDRNIYLYIVGAGDTPENEDEIRSAYKKSGIANVEFTGILHGNAIRDIYRMADTFVLPSYSEDQPLTLIEAMSCGLPVISTAVGSVPSLVEEGVNGFLVTPQDPDSLFDALSKILSSKEIRSTMGTNNRLLAKNRFGLDNYIKKLTAVYILLLK